MVDGIIDTHIHLCSPTMEYSWQDSCPHLLKCWSESMYTADAKTSTRQIQRGIFMEVDAIDPLKEVEWVKSIMNEKNSIIAGYVAKIPLEDGIDKTMKYIDLMGSGLVGVRRILQSNEKTSKPLYLEHNFMQSLEYLSKKSLPFDICAYHHQLHDINTMIKHNPNQKFVLDHLGKPFEGKEDFVQWSLNIKLQSEFPNAYCKLSPGFILNSTMKLSDYSVYIDHVLNCFDEDHIIVGSDWFFSKDAIKPCDWFNLLDSTFAKKNLSKSQINKIFNTNSKTIYNIK